MRLPTGFLLMIANASNSSKQRVGMMSIIIHPSYVYLEEELRKTFEDQGDVRIIVDRRRAERRVSQQPITIDRRRADRRSPKEELVNVVIST